MCDKCEDQTVRTFSRVSHATTRQHVPTEPCKCAKCCAKTKEAGRGMPQPTAEDRMTPELRRHLYTLMRRINSCWANLHKFAGDPAKHKYWLEERKLLQQRIDAVFDALSDNYDTSQEQPAQAPATATPVYLQGVPAQKVQQIRRVIGASFEAGVQMRICSSAGITIPADVLQRERTARRTLDDLLDGITLKSLYTEG